MDKFITTTRRKFSTTIVKHSAQKSSTSDYCLNLLKKHDYENFISVILLKNTARSCALAVRSFNVEVSRVGEQVSQPQIGLMRLKFWEDALDTCFLESKKEVSKIPHHPVVFELFKVINSCKLSKRYLNNLVQSRKECINYQSFKTLDDLEKYSEKSVSSVLYLILEGCGVRNVNADHAASHLGKAQGIVQQLRVVPLAKQIQFVSIPQDILIKHNLSQEEIVRLKGTSQKLTDCIFEIASRAHQHLVKSRSLMEQVPEEGRAALLASVATSSYLDRLQSVGYDVFHPVLRHREWNLLPRMWYYNFKRKY